MAAGFGTTKLGQSLNWNPAITGSISIFVISFIRFSVWIPAFRFSLHKSLFKTCFPPGSSCIINIGFGLTVTLFSLLTVFVVALCSGWINLEGWMWNRIGFTDFLFACFVSVLLNALVALLEEIIFRGYLINALRTVWDVKTAIIASSVLFSFAHLLPYASKYSLFDVTLLIVLFILFGLFFGWVYIKTGSLWLPVAIHFAWDFLENDVINLSGDAFNPHLIGAVTSLKGPLAVPGIENAILLDLFSLILIFAGVYFLSGNIKKLKHSVLN